MNDNSAIIGMPPDVVNDPDAVLTRQAVLAAAAEGMAPLIEQMQNDIAALQAANQEQAGEIARLEEAARAGADQLNRMQTDKAAEAEVVRLQEAMKCLPCPTPEEEGETVGHCTGHGECDCELGYCLTAATWTPPATEAAPS